MPSADDDDNIEDEDEMVIKKDRPIQSHMMFQVPLVQHMQSL